MARWLPIGLMAFALTAVLMGCKGGDAPKRDGGKKENPAAQGGKKANGTEEESAKESPKSGEVKPDFKLEVKALVKEFEDNKATADQKYTGKVLEVTGPVDRVIGKTALTLTPNPEKPDPLRYEVFCEAKSDLGGKVVGLSRGQPVRVLGKYYRVTDAIQLELLSLTELEPSKLIKTTDEQFAKEFTDDPEAAKKKYATEDVLRGKDLLLSARVQEIKSGFRPLVALAGDGKSKIEVEIGRDEADEWKGKKQVQVRATYFSFDGDKKAVLLRHAILVEGK